MTKRRVLIVDDELAISRVLKLALERTRLYLVRTEEDSTKALASARGFRPDLILLDVMMPSIDGGELAGLIRQEPLLKDTPIIFLTSLISSNDDAKPFGGQGSTFIAKPINLTFLLSTMEKVLGPAVAGANPASHS